MFWNEQMLYSLLYLITHFFSTHSMGKRLKFHDFPIGFFGLDPRGPFGAIPDRRRQTLIEVRFMADHEDAALIFL